MTGLLILASHQGAIRTDPTDGYYLTEEARSEARFIAYCLQEYRLTADQIFCAETDAMLECAEIVRGCLTWPASVVMHGDLNILAAIDDTAVNGVLNRATIGRPVPSSDLAPDMKHGSRRALIDYFRLRVFPTVSSSNVLVIGKPPALSDLMLEIEGLSSFDGQSPGIRYGEVIAYHLIGEVRKRPNAVRVVRTSVGKTMA